MKRTIIGMLLVMAAVLAFGKGGPEASGAQAAGDFKRVEVGELQFDWMVDGEDLVIRMSGPTTGWVAIGFDPETAMQGANFLMGTVVNGEAVVRDDFGNGMFSHKSDVDLGGSSDITVISGSESEGKTTVEFSIPLDSGDAYDKALIPGESYRVIWAYGQSNDETFQLKHVARGGFDVEL